MKKDPFAPDTFPLGEPVKLPITGSWPESVHLFAQENIDALQAAIAARRPLLVRGEPGTGKSQLARAAAHALDRVFVSEVVHSRSESQDLQYYFDAVARLGEAQALGAACNGSEISTRLDPRRFLSPGALWWVFDWVSAEKQRKKCSHTLRCPQPPTGWKPADGSVLLIDEIDKADADLPNGLLETLGNGAFTVPYVEETIGFADDVPPPLVIITTNEERELPAAFLRRCLVLHLSLPKDDEELKQWLMDRGKAHFGDRCGEPVRRKAAEQLIIDRKQAGEISQAKPGQAEYLDLLRAVTRISDDEDGQKKILERISRFVLQKHTGLAR